MAKTAKLESVFTLPETLGGTIDSLKTNRDKIKALNDKINSIKKDQAQLEEHLYALMDAQGVDKSSGQLATASLGEDELTTVNDWDKFYNFVRRNNAFYLMERRVAQAAHRELRAGRRGKAPVPGTETFKKRKINLRAK